MDRKAELEKKKQKLAELRKQRELKKAERDSQSKTPAASVSPEPSGSSRDEVNALVSSLIGDKGGSPRSTSPAPQAKPEAAATASRAEEPPATVTTTPGKRTVKLSVSTISQTSIPPKELVTYSKEVQTDCVEQDADDEFPVLPVEEAIPAPGEKEAVAEQKTGNEEEEIVPVRELSEEDRMHIMRSQDFGLFFTHASKLMERALTERDFAVDYRGDGEEGDQEAAAGSRIKLSRQFVDDRWSRRRAVTCLDWSSQYPELVVASYNNNEEAPQDPDGIVLVWNSRFQAQTPEYVFHCQSPVMSASFTKFHPHLVLGGCYSGQIALWDSRSNKRTPVQRTPLSAQAHTHPVYCLAVVGTQNAHNLISISTDGKMRSWSLDMLSHPQDSQELRYKEAKSVAVTSLSFPVGEVNNFVVGSEDGTVYTGCRHGSKAGIFGELYEGHYGPVTAINCHPASGQVDFSNLFLTSSFDWTVKLWNQKQQHPLYSFESSSDYVFDVQWSPVHPSVFASVDGMGKVDIWNLNSDTEVPVLSEMVDSVSAINRVRWSHSGQQLACGNAAGTVYIYDTGEHFYQPRPDEWSRLKRTLEDLQVTESSVIGSSISHY